MKDVNVLREALPYIRRFKGATFVVKFGGEIADEPERLASLYERFCEEVQAADPSFWREWDAYRRAPDAPRIDAAAHAG